MGRLDQLPPDQRAVLALLLKQHKSYDEIASVLHIDRSAVRARAHDALRALGPEEPAGLDDGRTGDLGDYLLGQCDATASESTRTYLERSPGARAWGRVVAAELGELAVDGLPQIPAGEDGRDGGFAALGARRSGRERPQRSSRLGGALLLGAVGIAVAVGILFLLRGGGDDKGTGPVGGVSTAAATSTTPSSTASGSPRVVAQINLLPPGGGKKPVGVANIVAQGARHGIALVGRGLAPTTGSVSYAMWLENSSTDAERLGFFPPVGKDGRLQGFVLAPANFSRFRSLVVTREAGRSPRRPGPVVLVATLPTG